MGEVTMIVRHKIGMLGKFAIHATAALNRVGVRVPMRLIVWAVEHSSYVSIEGGRWQRCRLGLRAEEIE